MLCAFDEGWLTLLGEVLEYAIFWSLLPSELSEAGRKRSGLWIGLSGKGKKTVRVGYEIVHQLYSCVSLVF